MKIGKTVFSLFIASLLCSNAMQCAQFPLINEDDEEQSELHSPMILATGALVLGATAQQLWQNRSTLRRMARRMFHAVTGRTAWNAETADDLKLFLDDTPELIHARNNENLTLLHKAAERGRVEVAQELIARGAHVNARGGMERDLSKQSTPLYLAAYHGRPETIRELLAAGADIEARVAERTALFAAAAPNLAITEVGCVKVVRELLRSGANDIRSGRCNCLALFFAQAFGRLNIVQEFTKRGAELIKIAGCELPRSFSNSLVGIARQRTEAIGELLCDLPDTIFYYHMLPFMPLATSRRLYAQRIRTSLSDLPGDVFFGILLPYLPLSPLQKHALRVTEL